MIGREVMMDVEELGSIVSFVSVFVVSFAIIHTVITHINFWS